MCVKVQKKPCAVFSAPLFGLFQRGSLGRISASRNFHLTVPTENDINEKTIFYSSLETGSDDKWASHSAPLQSISATAVMSEGRQMPLRTWVSPITQPME